MAANRVSLGLQVAAKKCLESVYAHTPAGIFKYNVRQGGVCGGSRKEGGLLCTPA